ncbi:hypothetical protein H4R20_000656 [Coemansia guatemalensis]|uniref:Glycoside hydrolase family 125 protein n=1 Tax=Coemansia guatemalensis TaxID=2761395 RepID=A0A9W8HYR8_9FUNG|nr:hypothetical protein H4R20_000656 [Coemansia guatemalensis]
MNWTVSGCPSDFSYLKWASEPHEPRTDGQLRLPSMRPPVACRRFRSAAIEEEIERVTGQISDADVRQLLRNIMPNTLDTAIAWHDPGTADGAKVPYTFVITGDINAQWTRDSANQILPLVPHVGRDAGLRRLVAGLVNMQAEQIAAYPFANAYKPPPRSGLEAGHNTGFPHDRVKPEYDPDMVYEAKFEIDSLAAFFQLSTAYWEQGTKSLRTDGMQTQLPLVDVVKWQEAVEAAVGLLEQLQQPTYVEGSGNGRLNAATVEFLRASEHPTESSFGGGRGNPVRRTGMVRTLFRPSDDAVTLPFFVPGNAMLAVQLERLAALLAALGGAEDIEERARRLATDIRKGIAKHAVVEHPQHGPVYAYEVDGFGGQLVMDDANVPSLLALPLLGFVEASDAVYQNTRRLVLSDDNPWHFAGTRLQGVGSPHTGFLRTWPMAVAVRALTSNSRQEVRNAIVMLTESTGGLGLVHESVSVDDPAHYSRPWFAWCNGVVAELLVDSIRRFPGII